MKKLLNLTDEQIRTLKEEDNFAVPVCLDLEESGNVEAVVVEESLVDTVLECDKEATRLFEEAEETNEDNDQSGYDFFEELMTKKNVCFKMAMKNDDESVDVF